MATKNIDFKEISVVVQGAVAGSKNSIPKARFTEIGLKSIRKYLPGATIILSTWEGTDAEGLDYDVVIFNKDPGPNLMGQDKTNCFRQIVSSINGLKACKTKYAIKMRTDFELTGNKFLDYFEQFSDLPFDPEYKILKQRVVTITTCNPNRRTKWPFNVCDWFFFGLREDVTNIFDIPLVNKEITVKNKNGEPYLATNPYSPEQYIWLQFLLKYKPIEFEYLDDISHNNIVLSEKYFANNCVFISARRAGLNWLKFPGSAYAQIPCLSNSGFYTFNEYKHLLNKYANNHLVIAPNILEDLVYFLVYNLRFAVTSRFPEFHGLVRRLIEAKHGRRSKKLSVKLPVK